MAVSRLLIAAILCLLTLELAVSTDIKNAGNGEIKRQQLLSMSKGGVVRLDDSNYTHFVRSRPRPYSIVVFFTADDPRQGCTVCRELSPEFETMAESYWAQRSEGESASRQAADIFFAVMDYKTGKDTFSQLGLQSVPELVHFPRSSKASGNDPAAFAAGEKLRLGDDVTADAMARWLRARTGYQVSIRRSATGSIFLGALTLGCLLLVARVALDNLPMLLAKLRNRTMWMWVSLGVYGTSISGVVFDVIRNPPPFYMNHQTGQIAFFSPQSNQQFVVEGLTVGLLNLGIAAVVIALVVALPALKQQSMRRYLTIGGVVLFVWLYSTIVSLYKFKNRWYQRM